MGCEDIFLVADLGHEAPAGASMRAALDLARAAVLAASAVHQVLLRGHGSRRDSPEWLNGAQVPAT
jgi:hypothetical protein